MNNARNRPHRTLILFLAVIGVTLLLSACTHWGGHRGGHYGTSVMGGGNCTQSPSIDSVERSADLHHHWLETTPITNQQ